MYNQGALAYQKTAQQTADPRTLEATLLSRSAAHLQAIRDTWPERQNELEVELTKNRKIWSIFIQSVTREDSPLPRQLRENIANLGIFIMGQTYEMLLTRDPAKLDALIDINRQISAGLRGKG
ncbi:flagellar biosynthesis regulator FlaF [Pelagibacterium lacus]|uniref:Flagellar biosynthesis regulatory protein FlaF n=1 Tax=Pelagibacterium lacus TaxID=2282655 RepID=A0A369W6Q5_9HYPH|nr:flagellar biosynthesis regulator FlaF [Pelagibacterium lacus]RDE10248.1 flagellar biosynthesis regulatory protein FlaF [Pelagibacterium lacus]